MSSYRRLDKIMLAAALFTVSGAILAYNIQTAEGGEISITLADITAYQPAEVSLLSEAAEANLTTGDSIFTAAAPSAAPRDYELLDPIVHP